MRKCALIISTLLASLQMSGQEYVDYEMFGAVGDGVADDQECIAKAHEAANEKGLPVKVNSSKTYYIGGGSREIAIMTDTDFGKAHFIIDDRDVKNRKKDIFVVKSRRESLELKCKPLKRTDKRLRCRKLPCGCLVEIFNEGKKIYIRKGLNVNNGAAQQEVLIVDRKGRILTPVKWDYDKITHAKAFPIDRDTLTIRGGVFTTIANQSESKYLYHSRGFDICRSNVVVKEITHFIEGELDHGAPYSGFIYISASVGVTVQDCLLTAHKTYWTIGNAGKPVMMGSYDLEMSRSVNTTIRNCRQTTDIDDKEYWGLMASNFCKGITLDDCIFSRFDAHQGVMDVTLTNCMFGHMGVRAVGSGTFRIENCEIRNNDLLALRSDYGSTWDGEVIISDCVFRPQGGEKARIISGDNDGTHDFGYPCTLPHNVTIKRLYIDDSKLNPDKYEGPSVFSNFKQMEGGEFPPTREGVVTIRGLKIESGKELRISYCPEFFTGYTMTVE